MNQDLLSAILQELASAAPRALHVSELCARVGIAKSEKHLVLPLLEQLRSDGRTTEMPGNRYRLRTTSKLPDRAHAITSGVLQLSMRQIAFVYAEDGGPNVFIPPEHIGPALHGDRVEVVTRPSPKGRDGTVIAVLRRRPVRFSGRVEKLGRGWVIHPDDSRLRGPMPLSEIPESLPAAGVTVIAEITTFPQTVNDVPSARVTDALGIQGLTTVEVSKIKIRENIIEEFDEESETEAQAFGDRVAAKDKVGREDLRTMDLVTIDPPDARDHDDAVYVERTKTGYRAVIAIADVSHYVTPGSALDRTALERGCSIYLPDRAIPMLPKALSTNLASLVPGKDRLCLGVEILLRKNGQIESHRLFEGIMKSGGHLTYDGVAVALGLTKEGPKQLAAEKRIPMLEAILELARSLRKKRLKRGALDFDLPEAKVKLDEANIEPVDCVRSRKDPGVREAYRMIEELMLLANEVVAADLKQRGVPAIYRIHAAPDEKKISTFTQVARALGHNLDVEAAQNPQELSKFIERIEGTQEANVLRYLLLRAMQQASYDTNGDVGHFGLAATDYLHFTSPIRRYPDLVVHRVVRDVVQKRPIDAAALLPRMRRAAAEASRLERRAMTVERDVVSLYRAILMRDRIGESFAGSISTIEKHGFYVALDEPFVDVLVPYERLNDFYEVDQFGIRLIGMRSGRMLELGQRFEVRIEDVRIEKRDVVGVPTDEGMVRSEGESRFGKRNPAPSRGDNQASDGSGSRPPKRGQAKRVLPPAKGRPGFTSSHRGAKATPQKKRKKTR